MKTPITYYGGKQRLLRCILPLIPGHVLYAEPFAGGGAVFFAKPPSEIEVLNDTNRQLITFYEVAKTDYRNLKRKIDSTLHSHESQRYAKIVYDNWRFFGKVDIAWAVWMLASASFASMLDSTFGYDKTRQTTTRKFGHKRDGFTMDISKRLENAQIECRDAVEIIKSRDTKDSFFYCDPPYFNSDMGHYKGYTEADFERLLQALSNVRGKFLLSSYPSEILLKYIMKNGWHTISYRRKVSVNEKARKMKEEVFTANYPITEIAKG